MRSLRLAIFGESPCELCTAACCKRHGPEYAVLLRGDEVRRFAAFSIEVPVQSERGNGVTVVVERVLPYNDEGRCQFLDCDDRCTIYDDRPSACRQFQCVSAFNRDGVGRDGPFLAANPKVRALLESL